MNKHTTFGDYSKGGLHSLKIPPEKMSQPALVERVLSLEVELESDLVTA